MVGKKLGRGMSMRADTDKNQQQNHQGGGFGKVAIAQDGLDIALTVGDGLESHWKLSGCWVEE